MLDIMVLERRVTSLEEDRAALFRIAAQTSQEVAQLSREMRAFKEEMRDFKEEMRTSREKADKDMRRFNKQMGELANKMGRLVEDLIAPSLPDIMKKVVNCPEDEVVSLTVRTRRAHPTKKGQSMEIDAIAACNGYILFNETKNTLTPATVDALLTKLAVAREFFPEYAPYKLIGAVSSLYADDGLARYAGRQGILVLALGGELMEVVNITAQSEFELREF
jgi:hypothetical protein